MNNGDVLFPLMHWLPQLGHNFIDGLQDGSAKVPGPVYWPAMHIVWVVLGVFEGHLQRVWQALEAFTHLSKREDHSALIYFLGISENQPKTNQGKLLNEACLYTFGCALMTMNDKCPKHFVYNTSCLEPAFVSALQIWGVLCTWPSCLKSDADVKLHLYHRLWDFDPDIEFECSMTAQVSALCMKSALDLQIVSSTTQDQT